MFFKKMNRKQQNITAVVSNTSKQMSWDRKTNKYDCNMSMCHCSAIWQFSLLTQ